MQYFTLQELCNSDYALNHNIDNRAGVEEIRALEMLVDNVLDPLRKAWGRPISVNSGYRSPALNRAIGGVPGSHHIRGMAADITSGSPNGNRELYRLILSLGLKFTQLIDEKNYSWLHVSYDSADLRCQTLKL